MELSKKDNIVTLSTVIFIIINVLNLISSIFLNAEIHFVLLLFGTFFSIAATVNINKTCKKNGENILRSNFVWGALVVLIGIASLIIAIILRYFKINAIPFMLSIECFQLAALLSVFFCCFNNIKKTIRYLIISSAFGVIITLATSICIEAATVLHTGTVVVIIAAIISYAVVSVQVTIVICNEKILYRFLIQTLRIFLTPLVVYFLNSLPVILWGRSWDSDNLTSGIVAILTLIVVFVTTLITELILVLIRKKAEFIK